MLSTRAQHNTVILNRQNMLVCQLLHARSEHEAKKAGMKLSIKLIKSMSPSRTDPVRILSKNYILPHVTTDGQSDS
jgi:hypothetical protein